MKNYHVYGIGNALVDQEFEVNDSALFEYGLEKGSRTLLSTDEFNDLLFKVTIRHEPRKITGGGSVANSLVACSGLGGDAFFSCKVSNDDMGDFYRNDLLDAEVDTNIEAVREAGTTGRCIVLVTPDTERTMATHLGISEDISMNEIVTNSLLRSQFIYFEGYLASSDIAVASIERTKTLARDNKIKIATSLADIKMIQSYRSELQTCLAGGVDLLFCNRNEAASWTNSSDLKTMAYRLRHECESFVITLGNDGALVCDGSKVSKIPGVPTTAIDTVGAGDAFSGAFLYGITHGLDYKEAGTLACNIASRVVAVFGARLSDTDYFDIKREFSIR